MEAAAGVEVTVLASTNTWAEQSLDALTGLPGVRRAGIAVIEGGGRRLNFTFAEHRVERPATWCQIDAYDDVPLNAAIRSGHAVVGTLGELEGSFAAFVERQAGTDTAAVAAVPLVADGQKLGGFVLFYRTAPDTHDARMQELVELGAALGEALERTRSAQPGEVAAWLREPPPGALTARLAIANHPAAVGRARAELRATLAGWRIDEATSETAELCMSELVTNAVVHAASGCWVQVTNDAQTLTVEVRNTGPVPDVAQPGVRDPLQIHGRGLQLVDALTSQWGASRDSDGFSAWFVLDR